jgi:hypothetical protein
MLAVQSKQQALISNPDPFYMKNKTINHGESFFLFHNMWVMYLTGAMS